MRKTLTALALALALAGCTSQEKTNEKAYPAEAKENFVDACATEAKKTRPQTPEQSIRDDCKCVVNALEDRIPYAQAGDNNDFKDLDRAARDGKQLTGDLSDDVDQATASCAD